MLGCGAVVVLCCTGLDCAVMLCCIMCRTALILYHFQYCRIKEKTDPGKGKAKERKRKGSEDDKDDDYKPLVRSRVLI